jgi:anaerobic ribonucleoside-triphosphate reductase
LISTVEQSFDLKEKAFAVVEEKESISHQIAEEDEEESQMDEMANEVADTIMGSIENETVESFIEQPFDELEKLFGEVATKVKDDVQEVEKQKNTHFRGRITGYTPYRYCCRII